MIAAAREHARIVVTETPQLQVSVVADCDPTRVDDLEAVETAVEYDEGLVWVQATAAPTPAQAVPLSDVAP
ncbi:hypothetical protein J6397_12430 [Rhodococcus qingshengii]|uniref:hypothetical protein n=1 Tax=Rhodococcus qingshengii TaxID=334542 RepID=UPI001AEA50D3|nr:hypothetical protein [Rhodococcus qingshengii]MBP1050947.1 hypothetical protein [Rhodococcus qingshengii]WCT02770.1 hypothetical protein PI247_00230 [Rhodococcus qingshengii]